MFEFDSDEYKSKQNAGYGPCAGTVVDPHGPSIEWADGENPGPLSQKYLVKAPAPLTPFTHDGQTYTVLEYTKEGVTPSPRKLRVVRLL